MATLFGGGAPAPAPASAFSFGGSSTPAPAPGLFGAAPAAPAAPAPSGFGFGAAPAAPAPSGFGFGAAPTPAPAASGFGFGAAPAAAAPAGGLFGSPAPVAAPQQGLFSPGGATPVGGVGLAQAALHMHHASAQEAARLESEIYRLHSAYSPVATGVMGGTTTSLGLFGGPQQQPQEQPNSLCRFQAIFYDPTTPQQRLAWAATGHHHPRPAHVDSKRWAEAVARNPDPEQYTPVCLVGPDALSARLAHQQDRSKVLAKNVQQLRESLAFLKEGAGKIEDGLDSFSKHLDAIRLRLLQVMRKVEVFRCMNLPLQPAERDLLQRMTVLLRDLDRVSGLMTQVEDRARAHAQYLQKHGGDNDVHSYGSDRVLSLEDQSRLRQVLNEQAQGLSTLTAVAKRDVRDVAILKAEVSKRTSVTAGAISHAGGSTTSRTNMNSNMVGGLSSSFMGR